MNQAQKKFTQKVVLFGGLALAGTQMVGQAFAIYPYVTYYPGYHARPMPGPVYVAPPVVVAAPVYVGAPVYRDTAAEDAVATGFFAGMSGATAGLMTTAAAGARKEGADLEMARDQIMELYISSVDSPILHEAMDLYRKELSKTDPRAEAYEYDELIQLFMLRTQ